GANTIATIDCLGRLQGERRPNSVMTPPGFGVSIAGLGVSWVHDMTRVLRARIYSTFISYASSDVVWAVRIAREIETYRVPSAVAAGNPQVAPKSRRLGPVFRDTDELKASSDLQQTLEEALRN